MSIRKYGPDLSESAVDEREWQAQERAAQAERLGVPAAGDDDPLAARYRSVSRALRRPLADAPPADFAASVVRQVATRGAAAEGRLERISLQVLTALLGLSGGVTSVLYGREWGQAIIRAMPEGSMQWTALVAACAGLHWAMERWRIRRRTD
jgi:hypothetical protein